DLPSFNMLAMRILPALQTGQIPVGGMTQSIRSLHPQLQVSLPEIRMTSGASYSFAVCARLIAVAAAMRTLALNLLMLLSDPHYFRPRPHQLLLARNHANDRAEEHNPVADPNPAHQRVDVSL